MGVIKQYQDGSILEYDIGKFDKWCVYYTTNEGIRIAPRDRDYFEDLYKFSKKYGRDKIYSDYVRIYDRTKKEVEKETLIYIEQIANEYEKQDMIKIDKTFTILYMGMIAEEKKENTKLGKRIKRLGVHALLKENKTVEESATFMIGKKWYELDKLCSERGF